MHDDETNIHAALAARRLNPRLRLVIWFYNRELGQRPEELLDQAAALAVPGLDPEVLDTSTTVLSDADTAATALAAIAMADARCETLRARLEIAGDFATTLRRRLQADARSGT